MALWTLRDLHLADETTAPMFREEEQGKQIAALCTRIAAEGEGELVFVRDMFDLTAMLPPPRGFAEFGRKMGIALADAPERDPIERCAPPRSAGTRRPSPRSRGCRRACA